MKTKHLIIAAVALIFVASILFWAFCRRYPVSPWTAHRARERVVLLHPGMTPDQVGETLGLSGFDFRPKGGISGPPNCMPMNYELWHGDIFFCYWDMTKHPWQLVRARFKNSWNDIKP
jgi:hypothetical protein